MASPATRHILCLAKRRWHHQNFEGRSNHGAEFHEQYLQKLCLERILRTHKLSWRKYFGNTILSSHAFLFRYGYKRCGLMIAASLILEKLQVDEEVDVFQAVRRVRISRPELVTSLVSHSVINGPCNQLEIFRCHESMFSRSSSKCYHWWSVVVSPGALFLICFNLNPNMDK